MSFVRKLSEWMNKLISRVAGAVMVVISIVSLAGVISRFIFNSPIAWTYELSILCFSWVIFLGMSMAFKSREHMSLTFITNALKTAKVKVIWEEAIYVVCLLFLAVAFWCGLSVAASTWYQRYNTLPFVSKGLFYLSMPVGALASWLHIFVHMADLIKEYKTGQSIEGISPAEPSFD